MHSLELDCFYFKHLDKKEGGLVFASRHSDLQRTRVRFNGGDKMSDLVSYALLAAIFVITGLRMFVEKPKKLAETEPRQARSSKGNEKF